ASIAQSYLIEGKTQKAFDVARASSDRSRHDAPEAAWVGGLAAWKMNNYEEAATFFSVAANSKRASVWLKSGSAFWAARSFGKMGDVQEANHYMEIAAKHPRTFYGLIAMRSLDRDYDFNWDKPELKHKHKKSLEGSANVQDAIALSKTGNIPEALTKLGKSGWLDNGYKQRQLLAYILDKEIPALSLHLGRMTKSDKGDFYDVALYPEAPWGPDKGYEVDSALVNALIRQESRFNPRAKNASGASGLMQLMPSTASYMAKGIDVALTHPQTNISVGQKYVRHLMMDSNINNDLFYMAVAYNAGPGNLARWKKQYKDIDDPLLFIESIPSSETRAFVERVMVNYWIYRIREGKDNPSLDAVAFDQDEEYTDISAPENVLQFASN
ncbi:MAG: transglycosylase, partial [Micavibrio aeruginosavorus]